MVLTCRKTVFLVSMYHSQVKFVINCGKSLQTGSITPEKGINSKISFSEYTLDSKNISKLVKMSGNSLKYHQEVPLSHKKTLLILPHFHINTATCNQFWSFLAFLNVLSFSHRAKNCIKIAQGGWHFLF